MTNAQKQNADKKELNSLVKELSELKNDDGAYTSDSFAAVTEALKNAKVVKENPVAIQSEIDEQVTALKAAKEGLKETNPSLNLEEGVYTVDSRIVETDGTLGYHQGIAGETRIAVDEKGNATAYMNLEKAKTVMDGQELASYYIDGFLYKDGKEFKNATVLETIEEAGTTYPTKVSFPIGDAKQLTQVGYYSDGDTSWVNEVGLELSNAQKVEVTKDTLKATLKKAENELSGSYTTESLANLHDAIAKASEVLNDPVAIQSEVDEQVTALENAINGLERKIDYEKLNEAIQNAEIKKEDDYTPNSYKEFKTALEAAKKLVADETATQEQVDQAVLELNSKMEGLIERADKTKLQALYEEACKIENLNYPNWEAFVTVRDKAKEAIEDANISQAEVDARTSALQLAMEALNTNVDKSALQDLVNRAEKIDTTNCLPKGAEAFGKAIESAKAVLANVNATQQEVDKQIQLLEKTSAMLIQKPDDNVVFNGTYTINGIMKMASSDRDSMGNPAVVKPMTLIVDGDNVTLKMEFVPLTTKLGSKDLTGYLAKLNYFPEWTGGESGVDAPTGIEPVPANVDSYYEDVYDAYNDPDNGLDANVKGKLYPHYMSMPISLGEETVWIQVYVPVMESIQSGNGLQYARLNLDWSTLKQVTGTDSDKTKLNAAIKKANSLLETLQEEDYGYSSENIEMLKAVIAAGEEISDNLNVDQTAVDSATDSLNAAMSVFNKEAVKVDKSELKKAIEAADSYLNNENVTYTEITKESLKKARDNAKSVYESDDVTQTQVNSAVDAINKAIDALQIEGADKSELKKALSTTKEYLSDTENYTAASLEALKSLYDTAKEVYADKNATQEEVDAQVRILNYAVKNLKKVEEVTVDKSGLHNMLLTASNMAGRENLYTADSIKNLKAAIKAAEAVYADKNATQEEVNEQASKLSIAMINLEAKASDSNSGNNNNGNNGNNSGLNISNLADGVYSITGNMVKVDKTTASMSDGAINHTVKLTVKNGKYYITLNFNGLTVGQKLGYLSQLKYFTTGYTLDKYGNPQGTLADATVDSYQKNSDGTLVSDTYGTNYPDEVTFELIPEALKDGYVPLQVFVPIMDAISSGTGTQPVFLKLDWSSLKATTSDDPDFDKNDNNGNNNNNNSNGNNNSSSLGNGSLGNNTLGSSSLGSSKLGSSSLGSGSSLKSGTSSLGSGSSLKSGTSSLGSGSSLKSASNVKTGDVVQNNTLWAAILLLGGVALLAGIMEYNRKKKANIK